jgi:hypothetical protein
MSLVGSASLDSRDECQPRTILETATPTPIGCVCAACGPSPIGTQVFRNPNYRVVFRITERSVQNSVRRLQQHAQCPPLDTASEQLVKFAASEQCAARKDRPAAETSAMPAMLEPNPNGTFSPEAEDAVATLVRVFNRACGTLALDASDESVSRTLARTIIEAAIDGESDPEALYQRAMNAVSN